MSPSPKLLPLAAAGLVLAIALSGCKPPTGESIPSAPTTEAPSAAAAKAESIAVRVNPLASAKDEVLASGRLMLAATSYHVAITTTGSQAATMEVDFVAPDRYRMSSPAGTHYIIGDTMHISSQGRTMTVPVPPGTTEQWRNPSSLKAHEATMLVESLGRERIDGRDARKYRVGNSEAGLQPSTMWIGSDGYPLQMELDSEAQGQPARTVIRYSRFNDAAIRVDPPA